MPAPTIEEAAPRRTVTVVEGATMLTWSLTSAGGSGCR
jgi:hypothetical protein